MATLRELSGISTSNSGTQPVRIGSQTFTPAQVQAEQIVDTRLDVVGQIDKGFKDINASKYKAEEDARKLRASDRYTNYVAGMQEIQKFYDEKKASGTALTSEDYKSKIDWQDKFYKEMLVGGVDLTQDKDTDTYKKLFVEPSAKISAQARSVDSANYLDTYKKETLYDTLNVIDKLAGDITNDVFEVKVSTLEKVGFNNARITLSNKIATDMNADFKSKYPDGALSVNLKPYLADGFTQKSMDKLFNDTYSEFGKRVNGEYKKNSNITEEAWDKMKKGFDSWQVGLHKKSGSQQETASATYGTIKSTEILINDYDKLYEADKQLKLLFPLLSESKRVSVLKAQTIAHQNYAIKEDIKQTYSSIKDGKISIVDYLNDTTFANYTFKSLGEGIPTTGGTIPVTREMKVTAIQGALSKELSNAMQKGDTKLANKLVPLVVEMKINNIKGTATSDMDTAKVNITNGVLPNFNDTKSMMTYLNTSSQYIKSTQGTSYTGWLNSNNVNRLLDYEAQVKKENPDITDTDLMAKVRNETQFLKANHEAKKNDLSYTRKVLKSFGINDGTVDNLVSGIVIGTSQASAGVMRVAISSYVNSDGLAKNEKGLTDFMKTKLVELDPNISPLFSVSTSIFNSTELTPKEFTKNLASIINYNMKKIKGSETDFSDAEVFQYEVDGEVYTSVRINDGANVHTYNLSPSDIVEGISPAQLEELPDYSKSYNGRNRGKVTGKSTPKRRGRR